MTSDRRVNERHSRRLEVRFWRRGSVQPHAGFTTNVSTTGLFLGTTQALEPGERLRLEVVDRTAGFVVEGEVARVHRVSIALRHVEQPGAGVRFVPPEELVGALVPAARAARSKRPTPPRAATAAAPTAPSAPNAQSAPSSQVPWSAPSQPGQPSEPSRSTEAGRGEPFPVASASPPSLRSPVSGAADSAGAKSREPRTPTPRPAAAAGPTVVPVEFPDRTSFLTVYHRDLSAGSLFISTDVPAALNDVVVIELHCPPPVTSTLRFPAKVVRRFEPEAAVGSGRNVLAGMGVRFLEPEAVRAQLASVLAELRK
jgi:hypothetical protein